MRIGLLIVDTEGMADIVIYYGGIQAYVIRAIAKSCTRAHYSPISWLVAADLGIAILGKHQNPHKHAYV